MSSKLKQRSITGRRYPAPILLRINRLACSLRTGSWRTSRNKKPRMVKLLRNATLRGNGVISGLSAPCITIVPPTDIAFAICSICGPPTASKATSRCSPPKRKTSASYKSGSSSLAITFLTPRSSKRCFFSIVCVLAMTLAPAASAICIAASPTLLEAAVIKIVFPFETPPAWITPPQAVKYCIQIEEASSQLKLSGL